MIPGPVLPGEGPHVPAEPGDLKFQRWLQDTQWWPAERHLRHQLGLLGRLLAHAHATVPFHRGRIEAAGIDPGASLTLDAWQRLPVLTRRVVQQSGDALESSSVPEEHGERIATASSGSTGAPVSVRGTVFDAWIFKALILRHYLWHPHDFTGRFVSILGTRKLPDDPAGPVTGTNYPRWGDTATFPFATGPAAELPMTASIRQQALWLQRQDPDYLLTYPSNLLGLAEHCLANAIRLPHLEHVATIGEVVTPELREAVRTAWDAPVIDGYSAQEIGVIAMQCPEHEHYHVAAEAVFVEVLNEADRPCAPGQIGRVIVTPLFNYATPLLRYALGDYAEVGPACPCGRGHPVLTRILGRERNALLLTASGERYWPTFGSRKFAFVAPVEQSQFVQRAPDWIEARLVVTRPLAPDEEAKLRAIIADRLPGKFRITFTYPERLSRNAGGKFEPFVSEIAR